MATIAQSTSDSGKAFIAIRIAPELGRKVKIEAAKRGITIKRLAAEAIEEHLKSTRKGGA